MNNTYLTYVYRLLQSIDNLEKIEKTEKSEPSAIIGFPSLFKVDKNTLLAENSAFFYFLKTLYAL